MSLARVKYKFLQYCYLGRLHSLTGAWLLLLPSFWSIALYTADLSLNLQFYYYAMFFVGAFLMRSFGCVINDMADINIDKHVERTKKRPLASGALTKKEAVLFMVFLAIIPSIIFLGFNNFAKVVAVFSIFFVVIYPFTKRFFKAPQLVLGITFNFGIILAEAVIKETVSLSTWILYLSAIIWTIAYDTIYAYQDYEYDKKLGVYSSAILIGQNPYKALFIMYILMFIGLIVFGIIELLYYSYYIILLGSFLFLVANLAKLNYKDSKQCFIFFRKNVYFAVGVWIAILSAKFFSYNF